MNPFRVPESRIKDKSKAPNGDTYVNDKLILPFVKIVSCNLGTPSQYYYFGSHIFFECMALYCNLAITWAKPGLAFFYLKIKL